MSDWKKEILEGKTILGIELGSTRIKAIIINEEHKPIASGSHSWENRLENGIWTYSLADVWEGLQGSYQDLKQEVKEKYGVNLTRVSAIGISGMMHGYMVFDKNGELLTPFRTWRNTITGQASKELTEVFQYQIPQRWSIAHLYQAILNGEEHLPWISYMTTLAGYVHWMLTGEKVVGIGDASGMFPIDTETGQFNSRMLDRFEAMIRKKNFSWKLADILPTVRSAGKMAGMLTKEGARLLDVSGELEVGIPFCPPEGDAGTGMVATNSVAKRTGNISAGTSVFAMLVLEQELKKVHPELDLVTTPDGSLVAMVHCNNCTSDLNAWLDIFKEFLENFGIKVDENELFGTLYRKALEGDSDCGGLLAYNYFSGEHITGLEEGRPLFVRSPGSRFNLANFMRAHLFTALGALRIGLDILLKDERVQINKIMGHGGLFKTQGVAQQIVAGAIQVPVAVMETAGEGGAWGIALLAAYMEKKEENESLEDYLSNRVFCDEKYLCMEPHLEDAEGFDTFIKRYIAGLPIEKAAVDNLK